MDIGEAGAESDKICHELSHTLWPIHSSRKTYTSEEIEGENPKGYIGHDLRYTILESSPAGKIALVSGNLYYKHQGNLRTQDIGLSVVTLSYLNSLSWVQVGRFGEISNNGLLQVDKSVTAISRIALFMRYGSAADDAFKQGIDSYSRLPGWGVRGSNLDEWYECQTCTTIVEQEPLGQDLSTIRMSSIGSATYLITTAPNTAVAEIEDGSVRRYFMCAPSVGREVDRAE